MPAKRKDVVKINYLTRIIKYVGHKLFYKKAGIYPCLFEKLVLYSAVITLCTLIVMDRDNVQANASVGIENIKTIELESGPGVELAEAPSYKSELVVVSNDLADSATLELVTAEVANNVVTAIESGPDVVETALEEIENVEAPGNIYTEIFNNMSSDEYELLALILALEAQTEPFEGQVAVVEVILNRVLDSRYPNTVHGVLSDKGEFSSWKYINHPYNTPTEEQYKAIEHVRQNGPTVLPSDYLYFSVGRATAYAKDFIKIGHHNFGRPK